MRYELKPLSCDPAKLSGLSEKLIISHWENNDAAADCGQPQLAKEAAGLLAISKGLSLNFADDHKMLRHGMVMYDALYAWCADTPLTKIARLLGLK